MVLRCGYSGAWLVALALAGCGAKSGTATPRIEDSGGAGGGDAGAPSKCSDYGDQAGSSIAVVIRNETQAAIYLGAAMPACNSFEPFTVANGEGAQLTFDGGCYFSCAALMKGEQVGCPALCFAPSSIALQPGESTTVAWGGVYLGGFTLPQACRPPKLLADQCQSYQRVLPGTFTFSAEAGTELDCSQIGGTCDTCRPLPTGGCSTNASLITGTLLHATTTRELGAADGVGPNAVASPPPLELVFSE